MTTIMSIQYKNNNKSVAGKLTEHLGIRQTEVVHNFDELLQRLGQSGIKGLLLGHGRDRSAVVIVRRV